MHSVVSNNQCRNCGKEFAEGHNFCAYCGQKVVAIELSVREILWDFWFNSIRPVLKLVRVLLVRPGYVARDYVEGKRKRVLGPYAFLFLIVGLASAAIALSGFRVLHGKDLELGANSPNSGALNPVALAAVADFFQRHINAVILLDTPLLAAFCRLLFRKEGLRFAEYLVLASYTSGMRSLFTTIVVIPVSLIIFRLTGAGSIFVELTGLLVWIAYFAFAMYQFSREQRLLWGLRGAMAAVLAWASSQLAFSAITMVLYFFYS
jgi:hypothetical protein